MLYAMSAGLWITSQQSIKMANDAAW